jgi:hypothetical protein
MARINRHTLYYRLMDFSLIGVLLMLADEVVMAAIGRELVPTVLLPVYAIIVISSFLIPALLIFQRWMRDDFSEMLWQRTAGTVLKLLILLPVPIILGWSVWILQVDHDFAKELTAPRADRDPALWAAIRGIIYSFTSLWLATPILFTLTFQWHRWRASR